MDIEFLKRCHTNGVIPKYLQFRLASKRTHPRDYQKYQLLMLKDEINHKETLLISTEKQFSSVKQILEEMLSVFDFAHICSVYLCGNDSRLNAVSVTHENKFYNLTNDNIVYKHNPDQVIHNFSKYILDDADKSLLTKGLNFALNPKTLQYANYCLNFELLYRDILKLDINDKAKEDFLKSKLKEEALSSFYDYNGQNNKPSNLTSEEFQSLQKLANNNDIIIQKSDKGNSIVLIDKITYIERMSEILNDSSKFVPLIPNVFQEGKELHYIEKHSLKLELKKKLYEANKISKHQYDFLKPIGSQPGVMYGLPKVHKELVNGCPKYRPILSALGTFSYNLAKFLVPVLNDLTVNAYTIKNYFTFGQEVLDKSSTLYMGSLDVESLFTNLPLQETIDICIDNLFKNNEIVNNLDKTEFRTLLQFATDDPWFIFNKVFYKQIDGVAMGSPLGPTMANIFLSFYEQHWLDNCPTDFKPVFYRRYVDDIFVMFNSNDHLKLFTDYMNTCHHRIKFTSEAEQNGDMPFLDFKFTREGDHIISSVYRKPTFTGVYTNFESLMPLDYKKGLIMTLLFRIFNICSNFKLITEEISKLKIIMRKNGYPLRFIDKCINVFFLKYYTVKPTVDTVEKKRLWLTLPFLGKSSLILKKTLTQLFQKSIPFANVTIVFKCNKRISNIFSYKDRIPMKLSSHRLYSYKCTRCNSSYYGMALRHTHVRWCDHMGISWRTNKKIVGVPTEIKTHSGRCGALASIDEFAIIGGDNNTMNLKIKESLLIKRDRPNLNINVFSTPLHLF